MLLEWIPLNKTSYEMWFGEKPDCNKIRVWGSKCYAWGDRSTDGSKDLFDGNHKTLDHTENYYRDKKRNDSSD